MIAGLTEEQKQEIREVSRATLLTRLSGTVTPASSACNQSWLHGLMVWYTNKRDSNPDGQQHGLIMAHAFRGLDARTSKGLTEQHMRDGCRACRQDMVHAAYVVIVHHESCCLHRCTSRAHAALPPCCA